LLAWLFPHSQSKVRTRNSPSLCLMTKPAPTTEPNRKAHNIATRPNTRIFISHRAMRVVRASSAPFSREQNTRNCLVGVPPRTRHRQGSSFDIASSSSSSRLLLFLLILLSTDRRHYTAHGQQTASVQGYWEGPYELPIVAASVANLPDGTLLLWGAYDLLDTNRRGNGKTWTAVWDYRQPSVKPPGIVVATTGHDSKCVSGWLCTTVSFE
jgi:hypothetical protein